MPSGVPEPVDPPLFDERFRDDLAALFRWRRDVRRFRREPLPDGTLERLLGFAASPRRSG